MADWCRKFGQPFVEIDMGGEFSRLARSHFSDPGDDGRPTQKYARAAMYAGRVVETWVVPPNGYACAPDGSLIYEGLGFRDYDPKTDLGAFCLGANAKGQFAVDLGAPSAPTVTQECVYIGGNRNFGHFLFQYLLKLPALLRLAETKSLPIAVPDGLPVRYLESFDICGFPSGRRIAIPGDRPCRFEKVWLNSAPLRRDARGSLGVWPEGVWSMCELAAKKFRMSGVKRTRLFISRGDAKWRRLVNESEIRKVLEQVNVVPIDLSELSAEQQISTVANADLIVEVLGAAREVTLFAPPDCSIVELVVPGMAGALGPYALASVLGQPFDRIVGTAVTPEHSVAHGLTAPRAEQRTDLDFTIDRERLERVLLEVEKYRKRPTGVNPVGPV